jgi:isopentenyldiphosphate isomerase
MNVVYVDSKDNVVGAGSIANAVDTGIVVRISRVFLQNSKGELLLQKRADTMSALPGRWDQTAGGHVDEGEDYKTAASRELAEEMGIEGVELSEVATFYSEEKDEEKIKKRFNKIFTGVYNGEVKIDNDEVADFQWISIDELSKRMLHNPDDFTDGFIEAFKTYQEASQKD